MNSTDNLKSDIETFCAKHSLSGSLFSKLATGDASFWHKFVRGRSPTLATNDKIRDFMRDYKADAK